MTRMFSYVSRLGASIAARTAVLALLIAVLAGAAAAQVVVLNPNTLTFAASQGSTAAQSQNVTVTLSTGGSGTWIAYFPDGLPPSWLTGITSAGFFTTTPLKITVNPTGLVNGTYTTNVRVYAQGYSDATSGVTLQVTMVVGATGVIETSVSSLSFAANVNGSNPANQTFNVSTTLTSSIVATTSITYSNGSGWLTASPASGTLVAGSPLVVTVGANVSGLLSGTYNATIAVTSGTATRNVSVQLVVSPGSIISAGSPVTLTAVQGSTTAIDYAVVVTNGTSGSVTVTPSISNAAGFLSLPNASAFAIAGSSTANITIRANPSGFGVGTYSGTLTLTPSGGTSINVTVNLTITATSTVTLNKTSMLLSPASGATAQDSFTMTNSSASSVSYGITWTYGSGSGWLSVTPNTVGTVAALSTTTLTVTVNAAGLATGSYGATINVNAGGSTQTISVTMSVGGALAISASPTSLTINPAVGGQAQGTVYISTTSSVSIGLSVGGISTTSITCTNGQICATVPTTSIFASSGSPAAFTITANPFASLAAGTYSATLHFSSSPSVGTIDVPLTINVGTGGTGGVTFTPTALTMSAPVGSATQSQQVYVSSTAGYYNAQVTAGGSWLSVGFQGSSFASVYVPGAMTVYANPSFLTAGSYYGQISVTGTGGTQTLLVTFNVGSGGGGTGLTVSPATLPLTANVGGTSAVQSIQVYGTTSTYFYATVTSSSSWLILNQSSGYTPGSIQLYANAASLTAGTYYGTITVNSTSLGTQTVQVTLTVGGGSTGALSASPNSLTFNIASVGGSASAQTFQLSSTGVTASYTASGSTSWMTVSPNSGSTPATITVSVNAASLSVGAYSGQVNITSSVGNLTVPVSLNVGLGSAGTITASPQALTFYGDVNGGITAAQSVTLSTSSSSVDYTITTGASWLAAQPSYGTVGSASPITLTVRCNPGVLSAGTYNGSIVVVGGGGSVQVQVTFIVGSGGGGGGTGTGGGLTASPGSITFTSALGSTTPVSQTISLTSSTSLAYTGFASSTTGWLTLSGSTTITGTAPGGLFVQANPIGLSTGTYLGTIQLTTSLGTLSIQVTFNVGTTGSGTISVSPGSLSFSGQAGGTAPVSQYVTVSSATGIATTFYTSISSGSSWLSVTPTSGYTPQTLTVMVNPVGLSQGTYSGVINVIDSTGFSQQSVQVTLTLSSANLSVTPASLTFTAGSGATAPAQTLSISSPLGSYGFTATASTSTGVAWLSVSPTNGTTPGTVNVTASAAGLSAGTYSGTVSISSGVGAMNVPVTFTVTQQFTMTVAPESLTFEGQQGAASIPTKTLSVNISTGNMQYTASATTSSGGGWLSVTPSSGQTPGTLTVTANPTGLNPAVYNGTVTVSVPGASNTPRTVAVTLTITSAAPSVTAILNAAAGNAGILAAGTITSIYGTGLGPDTAAYPNVVAGGLVPTQVGEVRVLFDGTPAPILYAQAKQINTVVPWALFGRSTVRVEVEYKGVRSSGAQIQLYDAAPALFSVNGSGTGPGAILNQDYSVNGAGNGAAIDSVVAIYATGMGQTDPQGVDGAIPTSVLPKPSLPASVLIGNSEAVVTYAGAAPGLISGAMQVNVRIPRNLQPGTYAVTLRLGRFSSQLGVTVVVK